MWIIPQNYQPSSASALATVASSEDLSLPGINIEQSLMWRSKPSPLRTWSQRWKRDSWFRHLSGRILKPCQHTAFETELTCSLAVIPASHFQQLVYEKAQKTQGTYGHLLSDTSRQLDLFEFSLKTSKDTSALDCETSLQTWKALVTQRRGEYSARLKSARLTRESEFTFWPTPTAQDNNQVSGNPDHPKRGTTLGGAARQWPTPTASDSEGGPRQQDGKRGRALKDLPGQMWPTPTTQDSDKATKKMREDHQNNLTAVVFDQPQYPTPAVGDVEKYRMQGDSQASKNLVALARQGKLEQFPTPTARDYKGGYKEEALTRKDGKSRRFDALPNAAINGQGTDKVRGHLAANWVEGLMGLPLGWTDLGKWGSSE